MIRNLGITLEKDKPFYFISYNGDDENIVRDYVIALSDMNIPLWYDDGIAVGSKWKTTIATKIDDCEAVIMFLSRGIFQKKDSYVFKEFEMATEYSNKRIIIVMLDKIAKKEVPVQYRLWWIDVNEMQCVNAFEYNTVTECAKAIAAEIGVRDSVNYSAQSDSASFKIIKYNNGNVYEGYVINGKRNGKGKYTWANGDVYEGDFIDNKRTGKGKYIWANGDMYEGDFLHNQHTGNGKLVWASNSVYEGEFVNGKRTGKGKYTWGNGKWNGDVYEGNFVNDKRTGKGKYIRANGDVYEGDFIDNKRAGRGTYTYADGTVKSGVWENDVFVREI